MNRDAQRSSARKRLAITLGISVGAHAIALATLKLEIPAFETSSPTRAIEVVELSDLWTDRAVQVVSLETASRNTAPSGPATRSAATSARVEAGRPGAAGAETAVAAIIPKTALPSAAPNEPSMDLTLASATLTPAPQIATRTSNRGILRRSESRGIVQRATSGGAGAESGFDFVAASDAAREAERERGGNGLGGLGGIGVTVHGGGDCYHGLGSGTFGGLGGVPSVGPGMGIIGRRPPGGSAINRLGPSRGW